MNSAVVRVWKDSVIPMSDATYTARVSYNAQGEPNNLDVKDGNQRIAHVKIDGSSAIITAVYPYRGEDCVYGHTCVEVLEYLETLPFVQAAKFGDSE